MQQGMYFGTRDQMTWIGCPKVDMPRGKSGFSSLSNYLNGGATIRRSLTGARRYEMDWPLRSENRYDVIHAYAEAAYGDGVIYFLDPDAAKDNVAPAYMAHSWLSTQDAPNLAGKLSARPTPVDTVAPGSGYPIKSARYTLAGDEDVLKIWIPVPSGYTAHVGAHGASISGDAGVKVLPEGSGEVDLTFLDAATTTRTNYDYPAASDTGIEVYIGGTGSFDLTAIIITVTDSATSPPGGWTTGKGHSGCRFDGFPRDSVYNTALGISYTSAVLQEVGAWE